MPATNGLMLIPPVRFFSERIFNTKRYVMNKKMRTALCMAFMLFFALASNIEAQSVQILAADLEQDGIRMLYSEAVNMAQVGGSK